MPPNALMDSSSIIDHLSPAEAKITLFRALFRGREDIYARRFESRKTGKSGYAPACANEWVRGICEKPRIKCAECPHRRFLAVTDDVIRWHLSGFNADDEPFVAGIYPLMPDETCWFLAIDFDKSGWRQDAAACLETSRHLNHLSARAPVQAPTCGSFSRSRSRRLWPAASDLTFSPRRWSDGHSSVSTRMTGSFRIRTRCRKEASAT